MDLVKAKSQSLLMTYGRMLLPMFIGSNKNCVYEASQMFMVVFRHYHLAITMKLMTITMTIMMAAAMTPDRAFLNLQLN